MSNDHSSRDPYRDNDDVRAPIAPDDRNDVSPDTKSEARGDARENVGNHSRNTAVNPSGADENDKTRDRPRRDSFDDALERSGNRKARD